MVNWELFKLANAIPILLMAILAIWITDRFLSNSVKV